MQVNCTHRCSDCTSHVDVAATPSVASEPGGRLCSFDWNCPECGDTYETELLVTRDELERGRSDHVRSVGGTDVHIVCSDYRSAIGRRAEYVQREEPASEPTGTANRSD
jgi:hypothetical protein